MPRRCSFWAAASLAMAVSPLMAQVQWTGPSSGVLFDGAARSLRPILGILGGGHLGPALVSDIDTISISPDGSLALAVRGGNLSVIRNPFGNAPTWEAVGGSIQNPSRILWSEDSATATIASDAPAIQWIRNLKGLPEAGNAIEIPTSEAGVLAFAVDAKAESMAAAVHIGTGAGLFLISSAGQISYLGPMGKPGPLVFSPDGSQLYAADRLAGNIMAFPNRIAGGSSRARGGSASSILLSRADGISDPVGLAIQDGLLYVAEFDQRALQIFELTDRPVLARTIELDMAPQGVYPVFLAPDYFALTERRTPADPVLIFDGGSRQSVFYVPAGDE